MDIAIAILAGSVLLIGTTAYILFRDRTSYDAIKKALEISRETDTGDLLSIGYTIAHTPDEKKRDADFQTFRLARRWVHSIDPYFRFAGSLMSLAYLTTNMELKESIIWSSTDTRHTLASIFTDYKKALDERYKTGLYEFLTTFSLLALLGIGFRKAWVVDRNSYSDNISNTLFNDLQRCSEYLESMDTFKA